MEEYEYSFKVSSLKPYINYCKKNKYLKKEKLKQIRVVYENINNRNIIARVTANFRKDKKEIIFDCKNVEKSKDNLKVSYESLPMVITDNEEEIESILKVLEFEKVSFLKRNRYVYEKDNVKFELDEYSEPKMNVVAIEGNKDNVYNIYNVIKDQVII